MSAAIDLVASFAASWGLLRLVGLPGALRAPLVVLATFALFSTVGIIHLLFRIPAGALNVALLLMAAAGITVDAPNARQCRSSNDYAPWKTAFVMASTLAIACVIEHFWRYPDGGVDAFIIWNLRARWLFRAREPSSAFSPDILFWTHQDYPLMVPGIVARGFALIGHESKIVPALVALLFASCAVAIVVAAAPSKIRWLAGLAVVTTPNLVILTATEQADIPLAAFFVATIALLLAKPRHEGRSLAAVGTFASMMAWTKNEGALLLLVVFATVIATRRRWRSAAAFALGSAPFVVLLGLFKLEYAPTNDLLVPGLAAGLRRVTELSRWWLIIKFALRHIFLVQVWSLHLLAFILFLVAYRHANAGSRHRPLQWMVAIVLTLFPLIWLIQPYDTGYMLKVTFDRLVMQLWPAMVLLAATRWATYPDSNTYLAQLSQT